MFFAFFLELYSSSSYFRVRGIYAIIRYSKFVIVAVWRQCGYFELPCGTKKILGRTEKTKFWKILKNFIFWNIFKFLVSLGKIVTQNWNKNGTVGQFYFQMTQNVALLTKIVALFGRKKLGRFLAPFGTKKGGFWFRTITHFDFLHCL